MVRVFLQSRVVAALAVFAAFLAFCPASPAASATGPADSVAMLQKGIDAKDLSLVETYLDIDAVVAKGTAQVLADDDIAKEAAQNPAIGLVLALGGNAATNEALRSLLVSEARSYVTYGVLSGAFAGKPEKTQTPYRGIFGKAFRGGAKDRKVFSPAKLVRQDGDTAVVTTTLTDGTKGRKYPLELRLEKRDAVWRVSELVNAAEFIRRHKEKDT
ncbi:MAG: hypothetical protein LIP28_10365 [Deltaproteobacteria bacterium]|nr:hypothetical protein [Deltaproteobacteria bacterium]